jgi:penicillin-binding protein 2
VNDRSRLRLFVLRVLVVSLLMTLFGRLWYLQVLAGPTYQQAAADNQLRAVVTPAARGQILDDVGQALVRNRTALVVSVDRIALQRQKDGGRAVLHRLAKVIKVPYAELHQRIQLCGPKVKKPCWNGSPYQPIPVTEKADTGMALQILERKEDFPGVTAEVQAVRDYPHPDGINAAHLVGYLGPITSEELNKLPAAERDVRRADLVGRDGLEETYDSYLRGRAGVKEVTVDHLGAVTGVARETAPVAGDNLVTSVNAGVQRALEDALVQAVHTAHKNNAPGMGGGPADTAAGVVMDAATGRIVAMASYPSYDPSLFVGGISDKEYSALQNGAGTPLYDKATQGQYPPGSTFKLVTTSSVVSSGEASLNAYYSCPSSITVGGRTFGNFEGESGGSITLHEAIVMSCDTVFYQFGFADWKVDEALVKAHKAPRETVQRMARAYGLGSKTGVDLPGESSGLIDDRKQRMAYWKDFLKPNACKGAKNPKFDPQRRALDDYYCKYGYLYLPGDQVNFDIGQGTVLTTPLQMAAAYAALVNGGTVYSPRVGAALVAADGKLVETVKVPVRDRLPVGPNVLDYIKNSMYGVTTEQRGTARNSFAGFPMNQVQVGGKTGTAEGQPGEPSTAWFASFAGPPGQPRLVSLITVHHGGQGGVTCAPATRQLWDKVFGLEGHKALLPGGRVPTHLPRILPDGSVVTASYGDSTPRLPGAPPVLALDPALPAAVRSDPPVRLR